DGALPDKRQNISGPCRWAARSVHRRRETKYIVLWRLLPRWRRDRPSRQRGSGGTEITRWFYRRRARHFQSKLFLDGAAEFAEMLAKRVARVGGAFGEVIGEAQLRPQCFPGTDRISLGAFALPDFAGGFEHRFDRLVLDENAAVVIGENDIAIFHFEIAEARGAQRILTSRIEALRAGRARAITPNRESDLPQLRRVAVRAPDDDRGQATRLRFE